MKMFLVLGSGLVAMILLIIMSPEGVKVNAEDCSISYNGHEVKNPKKFIVSDGETMKELDFVVVDCWSSKHSFTQFFYTERNEAGLMEGLAIWYEKGYFDSWKDVVEIYYTTQDGITYLRDDISMNDFRTKPTIFAVWPSE